MQKNSRRQFLKKLALSTTGISLGANTIANAAARKTALFSAEEIERQDAIRNLQKQFLDTDSSIELPKKGRIDTPENNYGSGSYAGYVASLGLTHITVEEVLKAHARKRNGVANQLPPEYLWKRMAPTLSVADELRDRLGIPLVEITSAYRCRAYNRQCPGAARNSFHTKNVALDLVFDCSPGKVARVAKQMRKEGRFKGGIGLYRGFVHIDTRGYNATW